MAFFVKNALRSMGGAVYWGKMKQVISTVRTLFISTDQCVTPQNWRCWTCRLYMKQVSKPLFCHKFKVKHRQTSFCCVNGVFLKWRILKWCVFKWRILKLRILKWCFLKWRMHILEWRILNWRSSWMFRKIKQDCYHDCLKPPFLFPLGSRGSLTWFCKYWFERTSLS